MQLEISNNKKVKATTNKKTKEKALVKQKYEEISVSKKIKKKKKCKSEKHCRLG